MNSGKGVFLKGRLKPIRCHSFAWCTVAILAGFSASTFAGGTTAPNLSSGSGSGATRVLRMESENRQGDVECEIDAECNDNVACTADLCADKSCLNVNIPDCVGCDPVYDCPPVEIVFIMDTSGSMRDEAAALCSQTYTLVQELAEQGLTVTPYFYGITTVGEGFTCLTNNVVDLFGGATSIDPGACPFPGQLSSFESWGPATEIVAERFPWTAGATKVIVPLADEGPCDGSRPVCADPGSDRDSINNALEMAQFMGVIVSPILGTGSDACVNSLASVIANGSGGQAFQSKTPLVDVIASIHTIVTAGCNVDDSCDDGHICTSGDHCVEGICIGQPVDGCRACKSSSGCNDGNACTVDICHNGVCNNNPNFDDDQYCCNPLNRALTLKDDGDPCTEDVCDPVTGRVEHSPALAGVPCDDGVECTVRDVCNGAGLCEGADISTILCTMNEQCFNHPCDLGSGFCVCGDIPTLCLDILPDLELDGDCHGQGSEVVIDVNLGNSTQTILGGQFRVKYDSTVLQFIDAVPGSFNDPGSPFSVELLRLVDNVEGAIFYAVGAAIGTEGTNGPALMAQLKFVAIGACGTDMPCYIDENPQHTKLTNDNGQSVPFEPCCNTELQVHGGPPSLNCPSSVVTAADPGSLSARVNWATPRGTSQCEGSMQISCFGQNVHGAPVQHLLNSGGQMPAGLTEFECEAEDSCGAQSTCKWTVLVEEVNNVEIDVQLSPNVSSGPFQRCVQFAFYSSCSDPPVVVEETLTFGFPFSLPGRSDNLTVQIPPGNYVCATARDPKHTLRSTSSMQAQGNKFVANFAGDPELGGNWLINGNLDGNGVIDSVDQAIMLGGYSGAANPNSPCGTAGFHADINGDGSVNANDLAFIQRNYLKQNMPVCCPNVTAGSDNDEPKLSLSLAEAKEMGLGDLSSLDLNKDGYISFEDAAAILRRDLPRTKRTSRGN